MTSGGTIDDVYVIDEDEMTEAEALEQFGNYRPHIQNEAGFNKLLHDANEPIRDHIREQEEEAEEEKRLEREEAEEEQRAQEEEEKAERQELVDAEIATREAAERRMHTGVWRDDKIQFPRLLAELNMFGLSAEQRRGVAESMHLPEARIAEVLSRATVAFQHLCDDLPDGLLEVVPGNAR